MCMQEKREDATGHTRDKVTGGDRETAAQRPQEDHV